MGLYKDGDRWMSEQGVPWNYNIRGTPNWLVEKTVFSAILSTTNRIWNGLVLNPVLLIGKPANNRLIFETACNCHSTEGNSGVVLGVADMLYQTWIFENGNTL
jgi:hypothetical protein